MISVNLIPMRRRQDRLLRARRIRWIVGATLYGIVLAVGYGAWRIAWSEDSRDLTHQLTLLQSDIEDGTRSVARLRAALRESHLVIKANQDVNGQPDWSLLLALLARLKGDDLVLNRCGLSVAQKDVGSSASAVAVAGARSPASLQLQGYGRSQAAISQFALSLERTGLFENVALVKTNRQAFVGGEAVAFRVECQLKGASGESSSKVNGAPQGKPARPGVVADLSETGGRAP